MIRSPILETDCGGGIWRTKYWDENTIGLACMHRGSLLYEFEKNNGDYTTASLIGEHYEPSLKEQTKGHLAYGLAVMRAPSGHVEGNYDCKNPSKARNRWVCASCSFYDDLVSLWSVGP